MSDDIGADSTLERGIAPILSIGDAFPKILITRTRHEPHTREGVLVLFVPARETPSPCGRPVVSD